jgi:hypothetical protein
VIVTVADMLCGPRSNVPGVTIAVFLHGKELPLTEWPSKEF